MAYRSKAAKYSFHMWGLSHHTPSSSSRRNCSTEILPLLVPFFVWR